MSVGENGVKAAGLFEAAVPISVTISFWSGPLLVLGTFAVGTSKSPLLPLPSALQPPTAAVIPPPLPQQYGLPSATAQTVVSEIDTFVTVLSSSAPATRTGLD